MLSLKQLIKTGFTTAQARALVAQQPSSKLSGRRAAYVMASTPQSVAAGQTASAAFTTTVFSLEDFKSVPAAPLLPVVVNPSDHTRVYVDAKDVVYVVNVQGQVNVNASNAGKLMRFKIYGWYNSAEVLARVEANGSVTFNFEATDWIPVGETDPEPYLNVVIDATGITGATTVGHIFAMFVET